MPASASIEVAVAVIRQALRDGVASEFKVRRMDDAELHAYVERKFWTPRYLPYRP